MLDEVCRRGTDERSIDRMVTRREAGAIWGMSGIARRGGIVQRSMLYTDQPDSFARELARYREVTPASIDAAIATWLARPFVEVETVPGAPRG